MGSDIWMVFTVYELAWMFGGCALGASVIGCLLGIVIGRLWSRKGKNVERR
jgi:hypothetical protein